MKRYETLAAEVAAAIAAGLFAPGQRLPSIRQASRDRGVSPSTVFEAYSRLEAQGLVEVRPRSGWYVTAVAPPRPPEPERRSAPDGEARPVTTGELVFSLLASTMRRDVVPLGSAFPDPALFPHARLAGELARAGRRLGADPRAAGDDLTPGSLALRRQIALRYAAAGARVDPEAIVVTNGALEALNLCIAAICRPGDTVIVESPCFYACLQVLARHGLHALEVATDPRTGVDLEALEVAILRHRPAAAWVMTDFQNPLGASMDAAKKQALVALASRHRLPLIEDAVYADLHDGPRPVSTKAFDGEGWVLHCGSFSKTLAPGWRVGWCAPGRFAREVAQQKLAASLATNVPAQLGIAAWLEHGSFERHLRRLRATLAEWRERYRQRVQAHFPAGTRIGRPGGGYFLWIELPEQVDVMALQRAAMARGISLSPGPMFSASAGFTHHLRMNCGYRPDARVAEAIAVLGDLAAL
ncbi:hypothetical protein P873_09135 [Arenimonas composti TR7-09 = DSM 18010]|uniref:HTH gntR-type domain-containing protein n=1 Tax=Arenimonas composti TR7-09 = DSM 18010 TaxID=1121013 RepID=A0A091BZA9_9GAMM|nr:hypothetical protein P873_09135 [Arenimonas composti TR7-09 = DSM 18010]